MEQKFWMVWGEQTRETRMWYHSLEDAKRVAERLAERNPGARFFVLAAHGYTRTAKPTTRVDLKWVDLKAELQF